MGKIKEHLHNDIELKQKAAEIEVSLKATRWFRKTDKSNKLKDAEVDIENKAIYGVAICTEGEALGHGVWLDSDFIDDCVKFGNKVKKGLKARFGHPQMSGEALGTYVGRFHNFRKDGTKAIADLYFDESAEVSPSGNLTDYLLKLAASSPDVFGSSIVFSIAQYFYKKTTGDKIGTSEHWDNQDKGTVDYNLETDEYGYVKYYISMKELYGADLVDEPAANPDGLFSSTKLHADKFAVIASEWLNANPNIAAFLKKKPHKITEFMKKLNANPVDETPIDDDNDDDLLLDEGKESDKVDDDEDDNKGDDQTQNTEEVEVGLSKRIKALETENVSLRKLFNSLEERVKSLETDPTADPTFSAKRADTDGGKPKQLSSWEQQLDKYTKK